MFEYRTFVETLGQLGGCPDRDIFELLYSKYGETTRFYHDRSHISKCLAEFQKWRSLAIHPAEVEAAIWFHDAIYDPRASNNEEQSAQLAEQCLGSIGVPSDSIARITAMILATKTHEASTIDVKLMVDVDLGILGASAPVFESYDSNIRKEYHWVPFETYRTERMRVLRSFLDQETIYHTAPVRELYETRARENLKRKIAQMASQGASHFRQSIAWPSP